MKSILKKLFLVSFLFVLSITCSNYVFAKETEEELQVYQIRSKDDGIITDKKVFSFYEENNERLSNLIEEKKQAEEAERLAKEEAERIEQENARVEAERIEREEAERIEAERQMTPHIESTSEIANFALQYFRLTTALDIKDWPTAYDAYLTLMRCRNKRRKTPSYKPCGCK